MAAPSFASTSSVVADGAQSVMTTVGPPAVALHPPEVADDPGGEVAAANKGRKSTADWIRDEVMGGTKPAYKRGGRQRGYDAGGVTSLAAPPPSFNSPSLSDFALLR